MPRPHFKIIGAKLAIFGPRIANFAPMILTVSPQITSDPETLSTSARALHLVDYAARTGQLEKVFHGVYAARTVDVWTRRRAALVYCRGRAALSHTTALSAWHLHNDNGDPIHVTVPLNCKIAARGLVVHRRSRPVGIRYLDGLPTTSLEQSLVDSWPFLPLSQRREPVIRAVTDRRTTPARIQQAIPPTLTDKATLTDLLHLLAIGCHSPLEIWGHQHIFSGPGMPDFQHQVPVRVYGRNVYLDLYAPAEKLNVELDGDGSHAILAARWGLRVGRN